MRVAVLTMAVAVAVAVVAIACSPFAGERCEPGAWRQWTAREDAGWTVVAWARPSCGFPDATFEYVIEARAAGRRVVLGAGEREGQAEDASWIADAWLASCHPSGATYVCAVEGASP
ncbi:MAG: hypothetical protein K8M05_29430 [Deltaproteobacteria bacterium]|nr:hypothetical protein [Kofleriaceae bacterium]